MKIPLVLRESGNEKYWPVCCLGRYVKDGFEYKIRPELEAAFNKTGILKGVELMGEKDMKELFRNWMRKTRKENGEPYSENTITSYCNAMNNAPQKLEIDQQYQKSIFSYTDINEYNKVKKIILAAPNFDVVNKEAGNQAFKCGMTLYEHFLNEVSNKKNILESSKTFQANNLKGKLIDLLGSTHNLILHGAPGTGKTWLAREIAKALGAETAFVQFHPSYDYTDFVEGLRPVPQDDAGQIGFELRDGVFKEFCKRALLSKNVSSDELKLLRSSPNVWKVSLEGTGDNPTRKDCLDNGWIRIGWGNYGDVEDFNDFENFTDGGKQILRSFQHEMQCGDIVLSCYSAKEIDAIGIVTGEYEYRTEGGAFPRYRTVKWLVKNIRENIVELNHGKTMTLSTIYKLKIAVNDILDIVKKYSANTNANNTDKFVFIIDEINRGDLSKIFGELFFCIDPGYRGIKGLVQTQYQNLIPENDLFYKGFFVPENVYIIGTMNDIDRSVETMDFAFRRRFTFAEIRASDRVEMLDEIEDAAIRQQALARMNAVNAVISDTEGLSSAWHIGGAYFLKLKTLDNDFEKLWEYHLAPLIKEYLRGTENEAEAFEKIKKAYDAPSDDFRARDSAQDAE